MKGEEIDFKSDTHLAGATTHETSLGRSFPDVDDTAEAVCK